jgi:uncharacterized Rmd1/YagE family protein
MDASARGFQVQSFLVGERIELRGLETPERVGTDPLTVRVADGLAVIFRYGVVTFFDVPVDQISKFLARLEDYVIQPLQEPETEAIIVKIDATAHEAMVDSTLCLHDRSVERCQVVADVLSKSVVLAAHELRVGHNFQHLEPVARDLQQTGAAGRRSRELLRHIGGSLLSELRIVGKVEVADKPELTWDNPELERLYIRLAEEFELRERHAILDRKLGLTARTAHTVLDLLQHRHSIRVEWYIVILIVVEILLTLYELFIRVV